jgi:hypothetical protein
MRILSPGGFAGEEDGPVNDKIMNFLGKSAVLGTALGLFLIVQALFQFYLIPGYTSVSGGLGIPDMGMAYSPDRLYALLAVMEGDVLAWYNRIQVADLVFPLAYAGFFGSLLVKIYRKKYDDPVHYRWIAALPFLAAGFDYLENLGFRTALILSPGRYNILGWILSGLSTLKFLALGMALLLILSGIGYFIKGRRNAHFARKQ